MYETKGVPLPVWSPRSYHFTRAGRRRLRENPTRPITFNDLSTNSQVIDVYLAENSPYRDALHDLAAFQEVDWLISALEGLLEHAVLDGRLHSLVTIATDTGRRASSNPHLQNWKMPEMAGVAIGDDGFTLVEIDYRNAENVMAALISADKALAAACSTYDFHATMAARYFGAEWEHADIEQRKRLRGYSKRITYGTNYGMGAESLALSLGVTKNAAIRWIQAKDRAFPKVTRMRYSAQRQAQQTSQLTLWTGRVISVPSPFVAWNYLCQGGVAEVLKRAIVVLSEAFRAHGMRSRVALDMHDALILELAHDEWDTALVLASEIMSGITPQSLHDATGTPLRWSAAPDLSENRRKWGATQHHPILVENTN